MCFRCIHWSLRTLPASTRESAPLLQRVRDATRCWRRRSGSCMMAHRTEVGPIIRRGDINSSSRGDGPNVWAGSQHAPSPRPLRYVGKAFSDGSEQPGAAWHEWWLHRLRSTQSDAAAPHEHAMPISGKLPPQYLRRRSRRRQRRDRERVNHTRPPGYGDGERGCSWTARIFGAAAVHGRGTT